MSLPGKLIVDGDPKELVDMHYLQCVGAEGGCGRYVVSCSQVVMMHHPGIGGVGGGVVGHVQAMGAG